MAGIYNCDECLEKSIHHLCGECSQEVSDKIDNFRNRIKMQDDLIEQLGELMKRIGECVRQPALTTADELFILSTTRKAQELLEENDIKKLISTK